MAAHQNSRLRFCSSCPPALCETLASTQNAKTVAPTATKISRNRWNQCRRTATMTVSSATR